MRNVLRSHAEVAHYWANKVQPSGRASRMFFENEKIYSYGHHFCIARHLPLGAVAFTTQTYSNSTSKHISYVRRAARHLRIVYCRAPGDSAAANMRAAREAVRRTLTDSTKPRIHAATRTKLKGEALHIAERANEYLAALDPLEAEGQTPIDLSSLEHIREELEAMNAQQRAREAERLAARTLELQEDLAKWRAGEYARSALYSIAVALRIKDDNIETSHGASIPLAEAPRLWALVERARRGERDYEVGAAVGSYRLTKIRRDGSIVVGCHDISYDELRGIAKQIGYINEGTLYEATTSTV